MLSDEQSAYISGIKISNPGLTETQLREALTSVAWSEEQIQEGCRLYLGHGVVLQKNPGQKATMMLLFMGGIPMLLMAGIIIYASIPSRSPSTPQTNTAPQQIAVSQPVTSASATSTAIDDRLVYRNDNYHFEFKYPKQLKVKEKQYRTDYFVAILPVDVNNATTTTKYGTMGIWVEATSTDSQSIFSHNKDLCQSLYGGISKPTTFHGLNALLCAQPPNGNAGTGAYLWVMSKGIYYEIDYNIASYAYEGQREILDSFNFF